MAHPEITPDTVYINPYTHQASLYGAWWEAGKFNSYSYSKRLPLFGQVSLMGLRNTAAMALGCADVNHLGGVNIPRDFANFLRSTPRVTAYDDFAYWDDQMIRAYGERKFVALETDDGTIYGRKD